MTQNTWKNLGQRLRYIYSSQTAAILPQTRSVSYCAHRYYLDLCWSPGRECSLLRCCLSVVVAACVYQTACVDQTAERTNWGNGLTRAHSSRTSQTSEPRDREVVRATLVCGRARCGYQRQGREAIGLVHLGAATCRTSCSWVDRTSLRCLEADGRRCIPSRGSLQRRSDNSHVSLPWPEHKCCQLFTADSKSHHP